MQSQRDLLSTKIRADHSQSICEDLSKIVLERNFKTVHTFLPMGNEVNIFPLIKSLLKKQITVVTPRALSGRKMQHLVLHSLNELEEGIFGTKHPANSFEYQGQYDLIIVPGLAFDSQHNRLGYGSGYYDNFLQHQHSALKVGICFAFQIISQVPVEPHDQKVDLVLSY